ncbi:MAG: PSD1 domain-containing protein [Bryobacterales bacterium]|nr:PSD1 domain-containing protein [Bryobacterales bacterium]
MGLAALFARAETGEEFFEKKIRPVLAEKCYGCHSAKVKSPMGGLRLDTAAALRKGGDSGPAVAPGDPAKSPLMEAIRYTSLRIKMPPTGKLPDEQISDFENWIRMGAPDPRKEEQPSPTARKKTIDWEQARKYWAFQPVRKPAVPTVQNVSWVRTPVDAFVLAKLGERRLNPAPPADKRSWIRRVTFDLIGLPPTPEEVTAYLSDNSAEADRRVVDRLLSSPHYGERWARPWLDLMRVAETNGHEFDNDKLDAWRYRDYVIRAFNEDVPYNQFVREHIAGDLLPGKRRSPDGAYWESPIGTGMFWLWEVLNSATDSVKSRADTVDNQLDVLGKTFLGLTVACARCHDHKFDPIPTADYYSLAGIMHSTEIREAVIDSPERAREIASLHQRLTDVNEQIRALLPPPPASKSAVLKLRPGDILFEDFEDLGYAGWTPTGEAFGSAPSHTVAPNQPLNNYRGEGMANSFGGGTDRLVGSLTSKTFKMPKLWVHVRMAGVKPPKALKENQLLRLTIVADGHKSEHIIPSGKPGFEWRSSRMTKEIGRQCYFEIVDRSRNGHIVIDKIVISGNEKPPEEEAVEAGPERLEDLASSLPAATQAKIAALEQQRARLEEQIPESAFAMISRDDSPRNVRLHIRGNHQNLGEEEPRQFLRIIAGDHQPPIENGSGRLELAGWMASESNPLTARVMVNRIWKHHFGSGIVRTVDNFGKMGEAPSHPELLDWLACRFMESGWSVKQMQRLMVLSNTYCMSSQETAEAGQADPRNALLHHMPVRRLEAEEIRDSILAVSGRLDQKMFGPGIMPHISKYQDGRGKPESGPLDGDGRRSIYINVRRNFLTPMFLAFDYPLPVSTTGNRSVSTVPSQALMMMNNEFVAAEARAWALELLREEPDPSKRIDKLYAAAFARPPEDWEKQETLAFVEKQSSKLARDGDAAPAAAAWGDLCHVLMNSAEFIYVR